MFGHSAVFVNGNIFAGLVRGSMVLRLGVTEVEQKRLCVAHPCRQRPPQRAPPLA